jgi:hypothetical protein
MDMKWVERTIMTILLAIIAYLWQQQSAKLERLLQEFSNYKVYVAENFVSKEDYNRDMKNIDRKLDRILEILDKKADKDEIYRRMR